MERVGGYFTRQLLESRHRGAFELAYAGFVKMTDTLWKYVIMLLLFVLCSPIYIHLFMYISER